MTVYDAVMIGLVVLGLAWGAWRGFTWQVASLSSLVVGYAAAHQFSGQLAPRLPGEPAVARGLAMLVIYVAVSAAIFGVAWMVRAVLRKLKFEAYDRHLGMLLGGAEGALLGMVGTLFLVSLAPQTRASVFSSPTGRVVGRVMEGVGGVLPQELRTALAPFWERGAPTPDAQLAAESSPRSGAPKTAANGQNPSPNSEAWWDWLGDQVDGKASAQATEANGNRREGARAGKVAQDQRENAPRRASARRSSRPRRNADDRERNGGGVDDWMRGLDNDDVERAPLRR